MVLAEIFSRLWTEIDFDDHPHQAGHSPTPVGELQSQIGPGLLKLQDDRIRFFLYSDAELLLAEWAGENPTYSLDVDENGRPVSIHLLTIGPENTRVGEGRLGLHKWSLDRSSFNAESWHWLSENIGLPSGDFLSATPESSHSALDFSPLAELCLYPDRSAHSTERPHLTVGEWRHLLGGLRAHLSPLLPDWTWHLEVDNKADRCGWYVRAPENWTSLFTIFVGLGWQPENPQNAHGFLLFERAPPGELDRDDEEEANQLDGLRTVALCNSSRGALTALAGEPFWAASATAHPLPALPGLVELWPPSMGRWPLLVARAEPERPLEAIAQWAATIIGALQPSISTLPSKIEGLSWH